MRIRVSERYYEDRRCDLDECKRHYCLAHRMLWRDCDTAQADYEGSGRAVYSLRDCPECEKEIDRAIENDIAFTQEGR